MSFFPIFQAQVFAPNLTEAVAAVNASNVNLNNVIIQHTAADFSNCFQGNCDDQSASFLSTATLHWSQSSNIVLHNITVQHTGRRAARCGAGNRLLLLDKSTLLLFLGGNGIWFAGGVSRATLSSSLLTDLGNRESNVAHVIAFSGKFLEAFRVFLDVQFSGPETAAALAQVLVPSVLVIRTVASRPTQSTRLSSRLPIIHCPTAATYTVKAPA